MELQARSLRSEADQEAAAANVPAFSLDPPNLYLTQLFRRSRRFLEIKEDLFSKET